MTTTGVTILLLGLVWMIAFPVGYLRVSNRSTGARHVADRDALAQPFRIPPAPLEVRAPAPVRRRHSEIVAMPTPRPFTGSIPVLVVDGPPGGGHGVLPAPGLPIVRAHRCSYCRDGQIVMSRDGACPWCAHNPRAS